MVKILRKFRSLFRKEKLDAEMAEEMRFHLDERTESNAADGLPPDEARYAAQRRFGNVASIQEQAREGRGWVWLEQLLQDFRYALRQLARNLGFTATVVLVLGLGIGACTAVFTLVDAILFRPIPIRDPATLMTIGFVDRDGRLSGPNVTPPCIRDIQAGVTAFEDIVGSAPIYTNIRVGEVAIAGANAQTVTGNYFQVLGVRPVLGRTLVPDDDRSGSNSLVAVISNDTWRRHFGGDPDVIGRTFVANKQVLTVVGVAPAGFRGLEGVRPPLFWAPSVLDRSLTFYAAYQVSGRLKPGATEAQAMAELDTVTSDLARKFSKGAPGYEQYGAFPSGFRTRLLAGGYGSSLYHRYNQSPARTLAVLLCGAVGLVLLVACSNAASLLLVRALARRREIAVRLTLGATSGRLLRQLLVESLLLSLGAGLLGLGLAKGGLLGLLSLQAGVLNFASFDGNLDARSLWFVLGTAVATGLVFGLLPARQALQFDVHATLKQETPIASALHRRLALRQWLLLLQVTVGAVLLAGAGLCIRSVVELVRVNPGFDYRNVLAVTVNLDAEKYRGAEFQQFMERFKEQITALPGVKMTALSGSFPLSGSSSSTGVDEIESYVKKPGEQIQFASIFAGPDYFRLLGIPILAGREFDQKHQLFTQTTVLVNQAFVRRYWPAQNPLGKRLQNNVVIGVVADTRSEKLSTPPEPTIYHSITHAVSGSPTLLIKTEQEPSALAPVVRKELAALDNTLWPAQIETLQEAWWASMAPQRILLLLLAVFSAISLGLAAVGLYGFVSCSVAQRTREIGIRVAIGASARDILGLVMRQVMGLVAFGLLIGVVIALFAGRIVQGFLYGVSSGDPLALGGVSILFLTVASLACWLPARRAARVDPVVALRAE